MVGETDLDQEFIQRQRQRLESLREELLRIRDSIEEEERQIGEEEGDTQLDSGDLSQDMFTRELDAAVEQTAEKRLHYVERALQKIEEGSYGICDDTGEKIPKGRLEAVPEAIRTVEAQEIFERRPPV